jgi:hypothetical protein
VRKRDELSDPGSCLNKARDDEWVFTLLGRDEATPAGIRGWAAERIRLGLNKPGDQKILDALRQADLIAAEHAGAPLE